MLSRTSVLAGLLGLILVPFASGADAPPEFVLKVTKNNNCWHLGPIQVGAMVLPKDKAFWVFPEPYLVVVQLGKEVQYLYPGNAKFAGAKAALGGTLGLSRWQGAHFQMRHEDPYAEELFVEAFLPGGDYVSQKVPLDFQAEKEPDWATAKDEIIAQGYKEIEAAKKRPPGDNLRQVLIARGYARILEFTRSKAEAGKIWSEARGLVTETRALGALQLGQMRGATMRMDADLFQTLVTERERLGLDVTAHDYLELMRMLVLHQNAVERARALWPKFVAAVAKMPLPEQKRFHYDQDVKNGLLLPAAAIEPKRLSDAELRRRRDMKYYRIFFGLDDAPRTESGQTMLRTSFEAGMKSTIQKWLDQGKLDGRDPTAGEGGAGQHAVAAMNPMADMGSLLRSRDPPKDLAGNYYAQLTTAQEAKLRDKVLAATNVVAPAALLDMALEISGGNYVIAVLTCHNFLKNVAYIGRGSAQHAEKTLPLDDSERYIVKVAEKLANLRADPSAGDKLGPWYHMYGILFLGAVTHPRIAYAGATFEQFTRTAINEWAGFKSYSPVDPEKAAWDGAAVNVMYEMQPKVDGFYWKDLDVSGGWSCEGWGPLTLVTHGKDAEGRVKITGHWQQAAGKKGEITEGVYDPATGTLVFSYHQPWNGQDGKADFKAEKVWLRKSMGAAWTEELRFRGHWTQGNANGGWTFTRPFKHTP